MILRQFFSCDDLSVYLGRRAPCPLLLPIFPDRQSAKHAQIIFISRLMFMYLIFADKARSGVAPAGNRGAGSDRRLGGRERRRQVAEVYVDLRCPDVALCHSS